MDNNEINDIHPLAHALTVAVSAWNSRAWDGALPHTEGWPYVVTAERRGATVVYKAIIRAKLFIRQRMEAIDAVASAQIGLRFEGCLGDDDATQFQYCELNYSLPPKI